MTVTTVRNAGLEDLAMQLRAEQVRKINVVASSDKIYMENGYLHITGAEPQIDDDGVTDPNGRYLPTPIFDEGLADKLNIPLAYLRRLREKRVGLYDANVNGLLTGKVVPNEIVWPAVGERDPRAFLLRMFRSDNLDDGVARAFLSDTYKMIDHFDALTAAVQGIQSVGVPIAVQSCDLTDRRMVIRIYCEAISLLAPDLVRGYRSPFSGQDGADLPRVFAGFEVSNSETGDGAFTITPRIVFEVCSNGAKMTRDAVRAVHLGGKLDEGVVKVSEETQRLQLELITSKAADAVRTFLDADYMHKVLESLREDAGKPVEPASVIQNVGKKLFFSEETINGVLEQFIRGGQMTAGGVMQAVTAYAQVVPDADLAYTLEEKAVEALSLAAR